MFFAVVAQILCLLLDLFSVGWRSAAAKDLEILVLRQQLRIMQRARTRPARPSRWEKLVLAVLTAKLTALAKGVCPSWRPSLVMCTPETMLRWHRELVRRR